MEPQGKRLRIVSDGGPKGTRVEDEDGNIIQGVKNIKIRQHVGGVVEAQLTIVNVGVDVMVARRRTTVLLEQPNIGS